VISRSARISRGRSQGQHRCHRPPTLAAPRELVAREPTNRRSAASRSLPKAALLAAADAGSARTTTSAPAGKTANRRCIRWRSRRCTRCRTTEPPTVRPTTKPTRGGDPTASTATASTGRAAPSTPAEARCTTTEPRAARRPRRTAVAKSSRRVSRAVAESKAEYPKVRTVRPTTQCDPCGAEPRGWPDQRGSACAAGTRGSSRGDGCSAGTYACPCSRLSLSRCIVAGTSLAVLTTGSQPSGLR